MKTASAPSHRLSSLDFGIVIRWKGILQICHLSWSLVIFIAASLIRLLIQLRKLVTFGKYLIDKVNW